MACATVTKFGWTRTASPTCSVLKAERLGHDKPGMRRVYGHVSPAMRTQLVRTLQARWEGSLQERAHLEPCSSNYLLNTLLRDLPWAR